MLNALSIVGLGRGSNVSKLNPYKCRGVSTIIKCSMQVSTRIEKRKRGKVWMICRYTWTYKRLSCSSQSVFMDTLSSWKTWLLLFRIAAIVYPKAINPPSRRTLTSKVILGDIMNGLSVTHSWKQQSNRGFLSKFAAKWKPFSKSHSWR